MHPGRATSGRQVIINICLVTFLSLYFCMRARLHLPFHQTDVQTKLSSLCLYTVDAMCMDV